MKTIAIINPVSGRRKTCYNWKHLLKRIGEKAAHVETRYTEYPGHAEMLAAQARQEGFERVIVAGGDGTLSEAINGLWWEPTGRLPSLGILPFGTGCDYARNFDLGGNLTETLTTALGDAVIPIDLGICHLQTSNGTLCKRVFVNVLGMGYDANVAERLRRQRRKISGNAAYVISALQEMIRLKSYDFKGEIDGKSFETHGFLFAVGLGRYFGGGMMITPGASLQAGRFQLVWGEYPGLVGLLHLLYNIYTGRHLSHPMVHHCYARHLKLEADPPASVEAEGEVIGRTPIEIEIYPKGLYVAGKNGAIKMN